MATRPGVVVLLTALWLPTLLVSQLPGRARAADGGGWDGIINGLTEFDGPKFRDQVAEPLVQLSANAYRYPELVDVPGWVLSQRVAPIAPAQGGMHALVYEEEGGADGRVVVAFRGTQLGNTKDCDADLCADVVMWVRPGGDDCGPDPAKCSQFANSTLDYFAQAVEYTLKVLSAYPSASLLFTGHSLGAGLAVLVSAAVSTYPGYPVIAFSSAGTRTALQVRDLHLDAEHLKRIVIIADQWDEIMRTSWDEQLGVLCLYEKKMSAACNKCFESPTCIFDAGPRRRSLVTRLVDSQLYCKLCFLRTHYLANVMATIRKGAKPVCDFIAQGNRS